MDTYRLAAQLKGLAREPLGWSEYVRAADDLLGKVISFDRSCWHSIDPGTVLLTGSINREVECSGVWLAHHEYAVEDVNKWSHLAISGQLAGASSIATHGDLSRSARHRSHSEFGIADELRGALVDGLGYWAAVGFLRDQGRKPFSQGEVDLLASLAGVLAEGARRTQLSVTAQRTSEATIGPGVVILNAAGQAETVSPAAEYWIGELIEEPPPTSVSQSAAVQSVAALARSGHGADPLKATTRVRARTRSGEWLVLYGTTLSSDDRTVVVIQPATPSEIAPLVALAYELTQRECAVTQMCIEGRSTKQIASELHLSEYTIQDHLKAIFTKTGVRSRGELVGQVFLEHYLPRWEPLASPPAGWHGYAMPTGPERVRGEGPAEHPS